MGSRTETICNNYTSIATFLKFCGVDHKNLLPQDERPRPDDGVPEAYSREEVARFLAAPSERNSPATINFSISHRSDSHSYSAEAETLPLLFHSLLESNPNVKFIQKNWQQVFPADIDKLVDAYSPDWAEKIIQVSQTTSWSKYILRSATLVEKAQEIFTLANKLEQKKQGQQQSEELEGGFGVNETFTTVPADDEEDFS